MQCNIFCLLYTHTLFFVALDIIESQLPNVKQDVEKPSQKRKGYKVDTVGTVRDGEGGLRFTPENASISLTHTLEHSRIPAFCLSHTYCIETVISHLCLCGLCYRALSDERHILQLLTIKTGIQKQPLKFLSRVCLCFTLSSESLNSYSHLQKFHNSIIFTAESHDISSCKYCEWHSEFSKKQLTHSLSHHFLMLMSFQLCQTSMEDEK